MGGGLFLPLSPSLSQGPHGKSLYFRKKIVELDFDMVESQETGKGTQVGWTCGLNY